MLSLSKFEIIYEYKDFYVGINPDENGEQDLPHSLYGTEYTFEGKPFYSVLYFHYDPMPDFIRIYSSSIHFQPDPTLYEKLKDLCNAPDTTYYAYHSFNDEAVDEVRVCSRSGFHNSPQDVFDEGVMGFLEDSMSLNKFSNTILPYLLRPYAPLCDFMCYPVWYRDSGGSIIDLMNLVTPEYIGIMPDYISNKQELDTLANDFLQIT